MLHLESSKVLRLRHEGSQHAHSELGRGPDGSAHGPNWERDAKSYTRHLGTGDQSTGPQRVPGSGCVVSSRTNELGPVSVRLHWRDAAGRALSSQSRAGPRRLHLGRLAVYSWPAAGRPTLPCRRAASPPDRLVCFRAGPPRLKAWPPANLVACLPWLGGHPILVRRRTNGCASGFGGCPRERNEGAELLGEHRKPDTELHAHPAQLRRRRRGSRLWVEEGRGAVYGFIERRPSASRLRRRSRSPRGGAGRRNQVQGQPKAGLARQRATRGQDSKTNTARSCRVLGAAQIRYVSRARQSLRLGHARRLQRLPLLRGERGRGAVVRRKGEGNEEADGRIVAKLWRHSVSIQPLPKNGQITLSNHQLQQQQQQQQQRQRLNLLVLIAQSLSNYVYMFMKLVANQ